MDALAKVDLDNRTGRTSLAARPEPTLYDALGRPVYNVSDYLQRQDAETYSGRTPGPGVPLMPWLPHGDEPRQWMPAQGYNLNFVPRSEFRSIAPFQVLRTLADTSDIVRIAIEDVKQQVVGMHCDVHPTEESGTDAKAARGRIQRVKDFLAYPDGEHTFAQWLTMLLEEVLVIDAASIYRQRTLNGEPYALVLVDGSTIKPVIDYTGRAPAAPETAYQQIGYGRVETEFHRPYRNPAELKMALAMGMIDETLRPVELVYAPKAPRTWTPYGQSPVERVIITINLALRRQLHYLAYYTDGNIPDAFWKCPANWEPHQVKAMQDAFEKLLDGESGRRRRLRFMPGGEGAGLESARGDDEWKKEFDEYLARVVCYAFNTSPLPLVQLMNRATGEMADAEETHSGHHPLMGFVAQLLTREIQEFLGERDLEFIWTEDKERDERLFMEQADRYIARGVWSRNEVRAEQGKEEIPGGDVVTVDTPSGPVPLEDLVLLPTPPTGAAPAGAKNPLDVPLPPAAGGGSAMGGKAGVPALGAAPSQTEAARAPAPPSPAGKLAKYDPSQPRADDGKWGEGGGGAAAEESAAGEEGASETETSGGDEGGDESTDESSEEEPEPEPEADDEEPEEDEDEDEDEAVDLGSDSVDEEEYRRLKLDDSDSMAIADWTSGSGQTYQEMRIPTSESGEQWAATLDKLDTYEGEVHRGMILDPADAEELAAREEITLTKNSSASTDKSVAKGFMGGGSVGVSTLIRVNTKTAANLDPVVSEQYQHEEEVILRAGSYYKQTVIKFDREERRLELEWTEVLGDDTEQGELFE